MASASALGLPSSSASTKPGSTRAARCSPLRARTRTRIAGASGLRIDRQRPRSRRNRRASAASTSSKTVRAPDQRDAPPAAKQPRRGAQPLRQRVVAKRHAPGGGRIGRRILRRIERRIHQHVIGRIRRPARRRRKPRPAPSRRGRRHAHAPREPLRSALSLRQRRQRRIELDQRDGKTVDAARQRQAGRADAGAKIDRLFARLRAVAAAAAGSRHGRRDGRAAAGAAQAGRRARRPR